MLFNPKKVTARTVAFSRPRTLLSEAVCHSLKYGDARRFPLYKFSSSGTVDKDIKSRLELFKKLTRIDLCKVIKMSFIFYKNLATLEIS